MAKFKHGILEIYLSIYLTALFIYLSNLFKINLRKRGYSLRFIKQHISKINYNDRISKLYSNNLSKNKNILPFVTRFTPSAAKVKQIIRKYWPSITQLEQFKDVKLPIPTLAYKHNRNLISYIVRTKLQPQ